MLQLINNGLWERKPGVFNRTRSFKKWSLMKFRPNSCTFLKKHLVGRGFMLGLKTDHDAHGTVKNLKVNMKSNSRAAAWSVVSQVFWDSEEPKSKYEVKQTVEQQPGQWSVKFFWDSEEPKSKYEVKQTVEQQPGQWSVKFFGTVKNLKVNMKSNKQSSSSLVSGQSSFLGQWRT